MKLLSLAVSCLVFLGCKNAAKEFEGLADRACDCAEQDAPCGNKVLVDLAKFSENNKTSGNEAWIKAGIRLNDCLSATGVKTGELTAALERIAD
jgi:hypothetical protein